MDPTTWMFDGWTVLLRTFVVGALAYLALVVLLRTSGKRSLSKLNAFDLVVTVAMGSTLATMLLSKETSLAQGVVAFGTLLLLQTIVAALSARFPAVDAVVKSSPTMLFHRGRFLHDQMRAERVTEEEVRTAIRQAGIGRLEDVEAVVLESSGNLTCIRRVHAPADALADLHPAAHAGEGHPVV